MTSLTTASGSAFGTANPHALATILEAGETRRIISATDIYDISGELRQPLETSLIAEDGVSVAGLVQAVQEVLQSSSPLVPVLQPHAPRLLGLVGRLTLHPVAQLLLTAAQTARPAHYAHAVAAMALNGALMAADGGDDAAVRLALMSGLLHDVGEMYIDLRYGEADADRQPQYRLVCRRDHRWLSRGRRAGSSAGCSPRRAGSSGSCRR